METPIVIDACTLINLLRIDEDDDFLYKHLNSLHVHIAQTVYDEIKRNILRNKINEADEKRINKLLPSLSKVFTLHYDNDIKEDVGDEYFEQLCSFAGHTKKNNGELYSAILALTLSRTEESKVCFFTDDFPAKEEFREFFSIQQIGIIEDSIELLLMLHWSEKDFSMQKLKNVLKDLKAEYNRIQKSFVEEIKKIKPYKNSKIKKIIGNIEYSFFEGDMDKYKNNLSCLEGLNDKKIKDCLSEYPNMSKQPEIAEKIDLTLKTLKELEIYKLV